MKVLLASLAKLEAGTFAVIVFLYCSPSELVSYCLFAPLASLFSSYFPSNSCSEQLLYHTITQLSLAGILLPLTFGYCFIYSFFEFFHQQSPLISTSSCCSPELLYKLLYCFSSLFQPP